MTRVARIFRGAGAVAEEHLTLKFDGEAVAGGRMDVRDLAPSLLGFSDALRAAQHALYPEDDSAAVQITATAEGSFQVSLEVAIGLIGVAQQAFGTPSAALVHLQVAVEAFREYLALKVALRGRQPAEITEIGNGKSEIRVEGDGNTITVNQHTTVLLADPDVNRGAREAIKPLNSDGIDSLELAHRGDRALVHRADRAAFNLADDAESRTHTWEMSLQVLSVSFEGRQWRFKNGSDEFGARVSDQVWLDQQVATGRQSFRAGDVLRARVKVTTTVAGGKPSMSYEVVEVLNRESVGGDNVSMLPPGDE